MEGIWVTQPYKMIFKCEIRTETYHKGNIFRVNAYGCTENIAFKNAMKLQQIVINDLTNCAIKGSIIRHNKKVGK